MSGQVSRKVEFIQFLVDSGALLFGDFVTKSGRKTPYFVNTGRFDDGKKIAALGKHYAAIIREQGFGSVNTIFGPAYKGIPLAVATASALSIDAPVPVGFTFNRKEVKTHGDGGLFVGSPLSKDTTVMIVEDVITAGTTLREVVPLLRGVGVKLLGATIAVDRQERGETGKSAVQEAQETLGLPVFPIVTASDIQTFVDSYPDRFDSTLSTRMRAYREQYGVAA